MGSLIPVFLYFFCVRCISGSLTHRVSPAYGGRGSPLKVRVTSVSDGGSVPEAAWDYKDSFKVRWTNFNVGTKLVELSDINSVEDISLGNGEALKVSVPGPNSPIRAVVVGDPCFFSWCRENYNIFHHLPAFINAAASSTDVFILLGDNLYDKHGSSYQSFFSQFSKEAQGKLFITVPGNHDFWDKREYNSDGSDQVGFGFMQYFGQDSIAWAEGNGWDFSYDSQSAPANWKNFFTYSIVGNMGFIGFSGAHSFQEQESAFREACSYMIEHDLQWVLLIGHWDYRNRDAKLGTIEAFSMLTGNPGYCAALKDKLQYVMGHTHDNRRDGSHGFLLGAAGNSHGANKWGIGVFDSHNSVNTVSYFEMGANNVDHSGPILSCISEKGINECGNFSKLWQGTHNVPTSPPGPNNPSEEAPCSKYGWRFYDYYDIFEHNDGEERSAAESRNDCQPLCRKRADCSGYSWADNYCYLKRGSIELSDIERSSDVYSAVLC